MTGLEIALELIAENKETKNPVLNLEGLGLMSLPDELFELIHLKSLILGPYYNEKNEWINSKTYNTIQQEDINKLQLLISLQSLNLSYNKLKDLSFLKFLTALQSLDLSGNQLTSLSLPSTLTALQSLYLIYNNLTSLSLPKNLTALQTLDLSSNQLTSLSLPSTLTALQTLNLSSNKLKDLSFLKFLTALQSLDLSSNQLTSLSLPSTLTALQYLDLSSNKLKDFSFLKFLTALQSLDLSRNQLTSLSLPSTLTALQSLYLSSNHLTNSQFIRRISVRFPLLLVLSLYNNPLEEIDKSLLGRYEYDNCLENLKSHFLSLEKGVSYNNEVKMILLGNSTTGKTTLSKRLEGKEPDKAESSTHGIRQVNFTFPYNHEHFKEVLINLWDFGGQEYYHATHRLFLGYRTVYLVLWEVQTNKQGTHKTRIIIEGKEEEIELEHFPYSYWLDNIEHLTSNKHLIGNEKVPVLLVQNKIDKDKEFKAYQQEELDRVKETCHVSATQPKNLETLQDWIGECLKDLKNVIGFEIGKYWEKIRTKIRESKESFLTYQQYKELCLREDDSMQEEELKTLCQFLTDSGVILHYPESDKLKDYVFIKPTWVTDTIYQILSRDIIDKKGEFNLEHVTNKTQNTGIKPDLWIELLVNFELIFRKPGLNDVFVTPQYLPDTCGNEFFLKNLTKNYKFGFCLHYPKFLPKSTIQRIVREYGNQAIEDNSYWKNGILFYLNHTGAYINCEWETRKIVVWVENESILPEIWQTFRRINSGNEELEISLNNEKFTPIKHCSETDTKYAFMFHTKIPNHPTKLINNMDESFFDNLKVQIADNEFEEVFEQLLKNLTGNDNNTVLLISAQYNQLKRDERNGVAENANQRKNQIRANLISLIDDVKKKILKESPTINPIVKPATPTLSIKSIVTQILKYDPNKQNLERWADWAEINISQIDTSGTAQNAYYNLVKEADKHGKLQALLDVIKDDYSAFSV